MTATRLTFTQLSELLNVRKPYAPQPVVSNEVVVPIPDMEGEKSWAKLVEFVDTYSKGGHAYQGEWLEVGSRQSLPLASLIVAGTKRFDASGFKTSRCLYLVTGLGRVMLDDESVSYAGKLMGMGDRDRIEAVFQQRLQGSKAHLALLLGTDASEFPDLAKRLDSQVAAFRAEIAWTEKYLAGEIGTIEIKDIASAAMEIVRAGYRALALKYHPDFEGGSDEKMSLLNEANVQLREMLKAVLS